MWLTKFKGLTIYLLTEKKFANYCSGINTQECNCCVSYGKCVLNFKKKLLTMEFYAAMKKNEMLSFAGKWMELENIILSEVSLAQKTKNRMCSLICGH
jgi:hypothetical protein